MVSRNGVSCVVTVVNVVIVVTCLYNGRHSYTAVVDAVTHAERNFKVM